MSSPPLYIEQRIGLARRERKQAFQANLLIHMNVKPLQPILHTNHLPLTVMALSQGFYGFSPVEKNIY